MTKSELMDEAEASGLSAKPIKGGGVTSFHGGPPNSALLLCVFDHSMCRQSTLLGPRLSGV